MKRLLLLLPLLALCCAQVCLATPPEQEPTDTASASIEIDTATASPEQAYRRGNHLYRHGEGDPETYPQALEYFLLAAQAGIPDARFYAGRMYQLGHGTPASGEQAAYWYEKAGKDGEARAWNNLGNVYAKGFGSVPPDPARAMACYERAAQMGMAMGAYNLALVYTWGKHGIPPNVAKAREYYLRCIALEPRYPGVWNNYGLVLRWADEHAQSDYEAAERAFRLGVLLGDVNAMYNLSDLYYREQRPAPKELTLKLLEAAAEQNLPDALYRLGLLYQSGYGDYVEQDTQKAINYYEQAMEQGLPKAANQLALLLEKSGQEPANSPRIIELFEKAAKDGHRHAQNNLGFRILEGAVPGRAPAEGVALLLASARQDNLDALRNLNYFINSTPQGKHIRPEDAAWVKARLKALNTEAQAGTP